MAGAVFALLFTVYSPFFLSAQFVFLALSVSRDVSLRVHSSSAVSHLNVGVLLAANRHLLRQESSTYHSRSPVSSLQLPIGCGAYPKLEI